MPKKTAFEHFLGEEPIHFSDGSYVISAESNTKEEFFELLKDFKRDVKIENIYEDWVHFHFGENDDQEREAMWWLDSKGMKGAKKVWVC